MASDTPTMRQLMPDGFTRELARRTGCKQAGNLSMLVTMENTASKYWPAVEALASETNPEGFAQWKAAQHTQREAA